MLLRCSPTRTRHRTTNKLSLSESPARTQQAPHAQHSTPADGTHRRRRCKARTRRNRQDTFFPREVSWRPLGNKMRRLTTFILRCRCGCGGCLFNIPKPAADKEAAPQPVKSHAGLVRSPGPTALELSCMAKSMCACSFGSQPRCSPRYLRHSLSEIPRRTNPRVRGLVQSPRRFVTAPVHALLSDAQVEVTLFFGPGAIVQARSWPETTRSRAVFVQAPSTEVYSNCSVNGCATINKYRIPLQTCRTLVPPARS